MTSWWSSAIVLNVFKTAATEKGQASGSQLLEISLELFREKGFDAATMRDIAAAAKRSLGAFYYYYPSKDSIVLAYYRRVQDEHSRRVHSLLAATSGVRERLGAIFHAKLDILHGDREFMGALLRYTGNPDHPLSFLGRSTSVIREENMAIFRDALAEERLPQDMKQTLPLLLWAMQMGILLYFLYDKSKGQLRTHKLTDRALDLTVQMIRAAKFPIFRPLRKQLKNLMFDAGFLPAGAPTPALAKSGGQEN